MRKRTGLLVATLALGVGVLASTALSGSRSVAVPRALAAPAKEPGLLGIQRYGRTFAIGRIATPSLRVARPRLYLSGDATSWAYCPDRSLLAVATQDDALGSAIRFFDPVAVKQLAKTTLGFGYVAGLTWVSPSRLLAVLDESEQQRLELAWIDLIGPKPEIALRKTLPYSLAGSHAIGRNLALLVAPSQGIGPAKLLVVDAAGAVRTTVPLQILAGSKPVDASDQSRVLLRTEWPAFVADPSGNAAYVIPAAGAVARVDLSSLAVTYHALARPVPLLGRVHDWIEPRAEAKEIDGSERHGQWLGSGVIAVSGTDGQPYTDKNGQTQARVRPSGLQLIDTNSWATRMLDPGADSFTVTKNVLRATGAAFDTGTGRHTSMGLSVYGFDAQKRFHLFGRKSAGVTAIWGGRGYVSVNASPMLRVIDVRSGKILRKRRTPVPELLLGDNSLSR